MMNKKLIAILTCGIIAVGGAASASAENRDEKIEKAKVYNENFCGAQEKYMGEYYQDLIGKYETGYERFDYDGFREKMEQRMLQSRIDSFKSMSRGYIRSILGSYTDELEDFSFEYKLDINGKSYTFEMDKEDLENIRNPWDDYYSVPMTPLEPAVEKEEVPMTPLEPAKEEGDEVDMTNIEAPKPSKNEGMVIVTGGNNVSGEGSVIINGDNVLNGESFNGQEGDFFGVIGVTDITEEDDSKVISFNAGGKRTILVLKRGVVSDEIYDSISLGDKIKVVGDETLNTEEELHVVVTSLEKLK